MQPALAPEAAFRLANEYFSNLPGELRHSRITRGLFLRFRPACLLLFACVACFAQREAVLKQIDLPHPYYFREMYLPQLTTGPSAAAWSAASDGRWVVFARYHHDAIELWSLDLQTRRTQQMTTAGAVNVEPRFSSDGHHLAFVSTSCKGHFHIFVAQFADGL